MPVPNKLSADDDATNTQRREERDEYARNSLDKDEYDLWKSPVDTLTKKQKDKRRTIDNRITKQISRARGEEYVHFLNRYINYLHCVLGRLNGFEPSLKTDTSPAPTQHPQATSPRGPSSSLNSKNLTQSDLNDFWINPTNDKGKCNLPTLREDLLVGLEMEKAADTSTRQSGNKVCIPRRPGNDDGSSGESDAEVAINDISNRTGRKSRVCKEPVPLRRSTRAIAVKGEHAREEENDNQKEDVANANFKSNQLLVSSESTLQANSYFSAVKRSRGSLQTGHSNCDESQDDNDQSDQDGSVVFHQSDEEDLIISTRRSRKIPTRGQKKPTKRQQRVQFGDMNINDANQLVSLPQNFPMITVAPAVTAPPFTTTTTDVANALKTSFFPSTINPSHPHLSSAQQHQQQQRPSSFPIFNPSSSTFEQSSSLHSNSTFLSNALPKVSDVDQQKPSTLAEFTNQTIKQRARGQEQTKEQALRFEQILKSYEKSNSLTFFPQYQSPTQTPSPQRDESLLMLPASLPLQAPKQTGFRPNRSTSDTLYRTSIPHIMSHPASPFDNDFSVQFQSNPPILNQVQDPSTSRFLEPNYQHQHRQSTRYNFSSRYFPHHMPGLSPPTSEPLSSPTHQLSHAHTQQAGPFPP